MSTKLDASHSAMLNTIKPLLPYAAGLEKPTGKQILSAVLEGINIFQDKKNWIYFYNTIIFAGTIVAAIYWVINYASWLGVVVAQLYGTVWLSIFSTVYYHRFCSHRAFTIEGKISGWILKNLGLRLFIEEIFAISHQIHHTYSDTPHDPHFTERGGLFCYTSDVTMMRTNTDLDRAAYENLKSRFVHIPTYLNNFEQYKKWGTLSHPLWMAFDIAVNWCVWMSVAWLIAGAEGLATLGLAAFIWSASVRNFNYKSHGSGEDKRQVGRDTDVDSKSLNLVLPGMVAGEWHSNHHLYPRSANCGFKASELDLPFLLIRGMKLVGVVTNYRDDFAKLTHHANSKRAIYGRQ